MVPVGSQAVEAASTLALLAAVVAAFTLAARSGADWGLRRSAPAYTSMVFVGSVSVPAGGEQVLLDVKGAGELHGFTLKYSDLPVLVYGWFRLYIDGQLVEHSLAGIVALFLRWGTVDAGRPASPFTVTVYDETYSVYGFSMTAPVRFTSSLKLTVVNLSDQAISVDYAAAVSLERQ